jgi:hypothetical protein
MDDAKKSKEKKKGNSYLFQADTESLGINTFSQIEFLKQLFG